MPRVPRRVQALVALLVIVGAVTAPVSRAVAADGVSYANGVLHIEGPWIEFGCAGPFIRFDHPTYAGDPIVCVDVQQIDVVGSGTSALINVGADPWSWSPALQISVTGTDGPDTINLGQSPHVSLDARDGDDHIDILQGRGIVDESFKAGAGNDVVTRMDYQELGISMDFGPGDDTFHWEVMEDDSGAAGLVEYPFPGGGYGLSSPGAAWYAEGSGLEHYDLYVDPSYQPLNDFVAIPSRTTSTHSILSKTGRFIIDTRGLELSETQSMGVSTFTLPGFAPIQEAPVADANVYVFDGRLDWYIPAVYQRFLGRDPDNDGFLYWDHAIFNGLPRSSYVASLLQLPEHAGLAVDDAYASILGRAPESSGRAFWVSWIGSGHGLDALRAQLYGSPEYFANHGNGNSAFLDALYQGILHRNPDPNGKAYWLNRLNNGLNRVDMSAIVLELDEPIDVAVNDLYLSLLGRPASAGEQGYWRSVWHTSGEFGVTAALAGSDEYEQRVAPLDPADPFYFGAPARAVPPTHPASMAIPVT